MKLSISSIEQFKACRRAYELRKVYGVVPTQTSEALSAGSSYHEYIEDYHRNGVVPDVVDKPSAMANAYIKHIAPQIPEFEPEVWFEKDLGRSRVFIGRLDGKCANENAIVEHKTTSVANLDEYEFDLQYNEQLLAYFVANGCNEAYYTICKKPTIRQKQSESDIEFAERCLEWYDEDTFSKIRLVKIQMPQEVIDSFKKELNKMFSTISSAHKSNNFYRNPCNCNAWGRKCEYAPICHNYDPNQIYVGFERRGDYADNQHKG